MTSRSPITQPERDSGHEFENGPRAEPEALGAEHERLRESRTSVEAHGGEIRAENREQGGALFCFILPCSSQRRLKNAG